MTIRWHMKPDRPARTSWSREWYAEIGGVVVAEAVQTGRSGVDDYPWDWCLTDEGRKRQVEGSRNEGPSDSLRAVKHEVAYRLGATA
jgi:hypothetical protein